MRRLRLPVNALLLLAACAAPPAAAPSNAPSASPAISPPPTASPVTATATATASASAAPTPAPSTGCSPAGMPPARDEPSPGCLGQDGPPTAQLTAGGVTQAGTVGSFSFGGVSLDAPWLPADVVPPVALPRTAAEVVVSLAPPSTFVAWSARYADAADETGDTAIELAAGGEAVDPDIRPSTPPTELTRASFSRPPSGSWVLAVRLDFADGGDATYFWQLLVPDASGGYGEDY
jgi:hypothetical protein